MEVLKVTSHSGAKYFSKRHDVVDMMERVPAWKRIERVQMTEAQYRAIPATVDSAKVFR